MKKGQAMRSQTSKFAFVETPKTRSELGSQAHLDFLLSVLRKHDFLNECGSRLNLIDPSYKLVLIDMLNSKLYENGLDVDFDHYLLNGSIATIDTAVPKNKHFTNKEYRSLRMYMRFEDGVWFIQKIEIRHVFDGCDEAVKIHLSRHALAKVLNHHMSKVGFGHLNFGQIVDDDDEIDFDFVAAGFPLDLDKDVAILI